MYTAIIVEPRKHAALSFVLNNILTNLSDDWNIVICHGTQNLEYIQNIIESDLKKFVNRITLVNLGVDNLDYKQYSKLWATKSFYDNIPTDTFLKFETDSMIIPKNAHLIKHFLEYDYVGAPWLDGQVGNGGFSLRKKSKMLEIIRKIPYTDGRSEDGYLSKRLEGKTIYFSPRIYKPSGEKAKQFSVETVFYHEPFGCHKPWAYLPEFIKLYPEVQKLKDLQFSI
jgi:hypothetical protein